MPSVVYWADIEEILLFQRMDIRFLLFHWLPHHNSVYIAGKVSDLIVVGNVLNVVGNIRVFYIVGTIQ